MSKQDFVRTPDTDNTVVDYNLKIPRSLIIPSGPGFNIEGLQNSSGHIYIKSGPLPTDVALQLYINGQIYQLNQTGPQGERGPSGEQGPQGIQGNNGVPGEKGEKGDQGLQGIPGTTGKDGATGSKGDQGIQGTPGAENATLDSVCTKGLNEQLVAATQWPIAAQTFYKTSLRSAKRHIKDYKGVAMETISQLRVRTFKYKKSNEHQVGFIIDEILDPGLINSNCTAINTDSLLAVVVKAIQEQSAIISNLRMRVEALENGTNLG